MERASTTDCDESDAATYPEAPETNDGIDNQCPGDSGHGLIDEISGLSRFTNPTVLSWDAQADAVQYEVVRAGAPAFGEDCVTSSPAQSSSFDPEQPDTTFHYLVRALAPFTGSWGEDSTSTERTEICP